MNETDETLKPLSYQDSDGELRSKFDICVTFARPDRQLRCAINVINVIYMLEMWELGDILNKLKMNDCQALPSEQRFQLILWLERLTGHQKVAGFIPVWGSEIVFLRQEPEDRSSFIHSRYFQAPTFPTYISQYILR